MHAKCPTQCLVHSKSYLNVYCYCWFYWDISLTVCLRRIPVFCLCLFVLFCFFIKAHDSCRKDGTIQEVKTPGCCSGSLYNPLLGAKEGKVVCNARSADQGLCCSQSISQLLLIQEGYPVQLEQSVFDQHQYSLYFPNESLLNFVDYTSQDNKRC